MKINKVTGSHILGIAYSEKNILGVKFTNGRTNYYKDVPKAEAEAFISSTNKTNYFLKHIWRKYTICG